MKICIISPGSHVQAFSSHGDAEMALTHIILGLTDVVEGAHTVSDSNPRFEEHRQGYINYYKRQAALGKFTILDNSAYEIGKLEKSGASGKGLGADLVLQAADLIKPSIVICQDVLCDADATIEATKEFIEQVKSSGRFGNFKLMAVPQGRDESSWLSCYERLSKMDEVDMLGFSKISIPVSFSGDQKTEGCVTASRLRCSQLVDKLYWPKKPVHLLGGDNHLGYELSQQKQYDWIFSNDSSASVWYGMHGKEFDEQGKIDEIITIKPDLENLDPLTEHQLKRHRANILHNIANLHRMSK